MENFERVAEFYNRPNCGTDAYYPNNWVAQFVCELSKTKTLTDHAIRVLQNYDIEIEIVATDYAEWATR